MGCDYADGWNLLKCTSSTLYRSDPSNRFSGHCSRWNWKSCNCLHHYRDSPPFLVFNPFDPWVFFSVSQKWGHWVFLVNICQKWVVLDDFWVHHIWASYISMHVGQTPDMNGIERSKSIEFLGFLLKLGKDFRKLPIFGRSGAHDGQRRVLWLVACRQKLDQK